MKVGKHCFQYLLCICLSLKYGRNSLCSRMCFSTKFYTNKYTLKLSVRRLVLFSAFYVCMVNNQNIFLTSTAVYVSTCKRQLFTNRVQCQRKLSTHPSSMKMCGYCFKSALVNNQIVLQYDNSMCTKNVYQQSSTQNKDTLKFYGGWQILF